jgi:NhaP-type Na+/H+ or K+/H+ antiporter
MCPAQDALGRRSTPAHPSDLFAANRFDPRDRMTSTIQILVLLLVLVAATGVAAKRPQVPPAILLVLVGVGLTALPGLPAVTLAPGIILLLVLPLLVYSTAVAMSWREFHFNPRSISLLAVGAVVFTTAAAAAAAYWLLGMWRSRVARATSS